MNRDSGFVGRPLPRLTRKPSHVAVWVSEHAAARVAEHHDVSSRWAVVEMIDRAIEMPVEVVMGVLRRVHAGTGDRYFLAADRRGIFVLATSRIPDSAFAYTLVTYLRLSASQVEQVERLYPTGAES